MYPMAVPSLLSIYTCVKITLLWQRVTVQSNNSRFPPAGSVSGPSPAVWEPLSQTGRPLLSGSVPPTPPPSAPTHGAAVSLPACRHPEPLPSSSPCALPLPEPDYLCPDANPPLSRQTRSSYCRKIKTNTKRERERERGREKNNWEVASTGRSSGAVSDKFFFFFFAPSFRPLGGAGQQGQAGGGWGSRP